MIIKGEVAWGIRVLLKLLGLREKRWTFGEVGERIRMFERDFGVKVWLVV